MQKTQSFKVCGVVLLSKPFWSGLSKHHLLAHILGLSENLSGGCRSLLPGRRTDESDSSSIPLPGAANSF